MAALAVVANTGVIESGGCPGYGCVTDITVLSRRNMVARFPFGGAAVMTALAVVANVGVIEGCRGPGNRRMTDITVLSRRNMIA